MKISKRKLRRIIKEELELITEGTQKHAEQELMENLTMFLYDNNVIQGSGNMFADSAKFLENVAIPALKAMGEIK